MNQPAEHDAALRATRTAHETFRSELNHKLRTPLNAIIGFTELLSLQPGSKRRPDDVQQILKSAREMLHVIESELGEPGAELTAPLGDIQPSSQCDVLYIEDDAVNFVLVQRILEFRPGVTVLHACDGETGVTMVATHQPKLVLLDLNLPDMHGSDVLRLLQQQPTTAATPVVILSADATPSQIERLLTAGARNYLTKPFDFEQFLALVDEFTVPAAAVR